MSWLKYSDYWKTNGTLVLLADGAILVLLAGTELWLKRSHRLLKRGVLFTGMLFTYFMYYMFSPIVHGAEIILVIPMLLSLVYLDRKLLLTFGLADMMIYIFSEFVNESIWPGSLSIADILLVLAVFVTAMLLAQAALIRSQEMRKAVESLVKSEQKLIVEKTIADKLLKIDALTGLYNHKTFHEYMENLIQHSEANGVSIQLGILDIDNFKTINDNYGHWVGDIVLKEVANQLTEIMHTDDFAARYGGEEFAVIFTEKTPEEAYNYAEKIRESIERLELPHLDRPVTVSVGLCEYHLGDGKEALFRNADSALYKAKRSGKNRTVVYSGKPEPVCLS
ncbi:GGDEF domain-containing protein [Paenibacillus sp. CAA11]|uniref:GGDEF domain-containing protein n=1 Tax=Paenibacillus sp. CAA11 TaxID=1532905 RepID=UPI001F362F62|nr:GGDEF domain-containing protein [Paenibacillus sp. CAA11]